MRAIATAATAGVHRTDPKVSFTSISCAQMRHRPAPIRNSGFAFRIAGSAFGQAGARACRHRIRHRAAWQIDASKLKKVLL
ncbi:hypothetical protein WT56_30820 [Burkholderia pseudomultivorans]|uniref:Uncharacterized protein n=1 Tax=Burkholderia pseudomultivorans TaxID=1207504 RepID=A0A132E810_9BURK|nr:hypothetical protein WT56_30820 [Burkholderia pseudomultivorans]